MRTRRKISLNSVEKYIRSLLQTKYAYAAYEPKNVQLKIKTVHPISILIPDYATLDSRKRLRIVKTNVN